MDLQQAYAKIDELYSQYISVDDLYRNAIKAKLIKILCDVIKSDYNIKKYFENGDTDYLPILEAFNDSIKYYNVEKSKGSFHIYAISNIKKRIYEDVEGISLNLTDNALRERKRIIKLLEKCNNDKEKVAKILGISIKRINELLFIDKNLSLDSCSEEGDTPLLYFQESSDSSVESNYDKIELLEKELSVINSKWKDIKKIHKTIISDWLTSEIIYEAESAKLISLFSELREFIVFLSKFDFIDENLLIQILEYKSVKLPRTYDSIAEVHGVTKAAVSKKISNFLKILNN